MARYMLSIEDIDGGVEIILSTEDEIDLSNRTPATILIQEVMEFIEDQVESGQEGMVH